MTLTSYEQRYPDIPWRKPLLVTVPEVGQPRLACRLCVAAEGLRGQDVCRLPSTREAFDEHMRREHPKTEKQGEWPL